MNRVPAAMRCAAPGLRQRGFTLIELLVVFVLLSVMLVLAAPTFLTFQRNSELTASANSFLAALSAARAEAMKRQMRAFVVPADGSSWASGWTVYVDANNDVTTSAVTPTLTDASDDIVISQQGALPSTVVVDNDTGISGFADGSVRYAMFNGAGFMTLIGGSFPTDGVHALDLKSVTGEKRRIIANTTGRLRVCKPADAGCNVTVSLSAPL